MAWQFDSPESGDGMIEAFRRGDSSEDDKQLKLRGLEPTANYTITNVIAGKSWNAKGRELLDAGLHINIAEKPGVCLIAYRRAR